MSLPLVLKVIGSAKSSILMADYEFTSKPIADALINAEKRGVNVQLVSDYNAGHLQFALNKYVAVAGIKVRYDKKYSIMHNKFIIVDDLDVETGSFNYTNAAIVRNAENVIVIWNMKSIADIYTTEWIRLWNESLEQ
jgi:phosphatidylserine/phosphatidylglycerophosphate/cardiolipin synthase-like enzyme